MAQAKKANISRESIDRAKPFLVSAIKKNTLPMVNKIINAQFPINEIVDNGMTLLMFACLYANPDILQFILSKQPDVTLRDTSQRCALHYACMHGNEQNLQLIIQYYKDQGQAELFESRSRGGTTPLMSAILYKQTRCVQICLLEHMNPNAVDFTGRSCDTLAAQFKDEHGEMIRANLTEAKQQPWAQEPNNFEIPSEISPVLLEFAAITQLANTGSEM